jgi:hypothetical protein
MKDVKSESLDRTQKKALKNFERERPSLRDLSEGKNIFRRNDPDLDSLSRKTSLSSICLFDAS